MLNNVLLIAAALATATPATAATNDAFTGARVELNAGVNQNDFNYGAALGYDLPLGDRATVGVDAVADNVFDRTGRELGVGARLGYALSPTVLAYGRAGYTNYDLVNTHLNGYNVGGGLNLRLAPNLYGNVEYRYTDLENRVSGHGARVGIGLRF